MDYYLCSVKLCDLLLLNAIWIENSLFARLILYDCILFFVPNFCYKNRIRTPNFLIKICGRQSQRNRLQTFIYYKFINVWFLWNNGAIYLTCSQIEIGISTGENSNRTGFASQTQSKSEVSTWQVRVSCDPNKISSTSTDGRLCPSSHEMTNASVCPLFKLRLPVPSTRKERGKRAKKRSSKKIYCRNLLN